MVAGVRQKLVNTPPTGAAAGLPAKPVAGKSAEEKNIHEKSKTKELKEEKKSPTLADIQKAIANILGQKGDNNNNPAAGQAAASGGDDKKGGLTDAVLKAVAKLLGIPVDQLKKLMAGEGDKNKQADKDPNTTLKTEAEPSKLKTVA